MEKNKETFWQKLARLGDYLVDAISLIIAIAVDIILNIVCFILLSPDPLIMAGFIAIGCVVVLFAVRAWVKSDRVLTRGRKILFRTLWSIFAFVAFFFDTSLALEGTKQQSIEISEDAELKRLDEDIKIKQNALTAYQQEHDRAVSGANLAALDEQMTQARADLRRAEDARERRFNRLDTRTAHSQISADAVFSAIPQAILDGRIIQLIMFSLIFGGLQLTIITALNIKPPATVTETKTRRPRTPKGDLAKIWIGTNWATGSDRLISWKAFSGANPGYAQSSYKRMKQAAFDTGIIGFADEILVKNPTEAEKLLLDKIGS